MKLVSGNMQGQDYVYLYENTNVNELTGKVASFFQKEGYKLEQGTPQNGVYGTGNAVARFFFGAFVKRSKFIVNINQQGDQVRLAIRKGMTGFSGGLIGSSSMGNEYNRIIHNIKVSVV